MVVSLRLPPYRFKHKHTKCHDDSATWHFSYGANDYSMIGFSCAVLLRWLVFIVQLHMISRSTACIRSLGMNYDRILLAWMQDGAPGWKRRFYFIAFVPFVLVFVFSIIWHAIYPTFWGRWAFGGCRSLGVHLFSIFYNFVYATIENFPMPCWILCQCLLVARRKLRHALFTYIIGLRNNPDASQIIKSHQKTASIYHSFVTVEQ